MIVVVQKCENVQLMVNAVKNALIKNKLDADSFMGTTVCSVKNQECYE